MKRFATLSISALLIAAMFAPSLEAQSRSGSNSRGGSNTRQTSGSTSSTRSSGATRSTSTVNSSRSSSRGTQVQQPARNRQSTTVHQSTTVRQQPQQPKAQQPVRSNQTTVRQSTTVRQQPQQPQQPVRSGSNVQQRKSSSGSVTVGRPSGSPSVSPSRQPQQPKAQQPTARPQRPSGNNNNGYSRAERRQPQPNRVQQRPVHHSRPAPPPARREPIHHHHSHVFWNHGPHYYGYRVTVLPSHHVRHVHYGVPYYIVDNVYYRLRDGHYYVCRPPYGVVFNQVAEAVAYTACKIAFYSSVVNTYNTINQNAALIAQQNATIAANNALIAEQNETIALNNRMASESYQLATRLGLVQSYGNASIEYFYDDGVFFSKQADGSYVTMVPPAGALVQELPEDYEMKVLADGNAYYLVDNTVFRLSVVDGTAYFEVIGQLIESA